MITEKNNLHFIELHEKFNLATWHMKTWNSEMFYTENFHSLLLSFVHLKL